MADQLFSDNNQAPQETPAQTVQPPVHNDVFADQLAAIKNEKGEQKYATPEDALKALQHSQEYIPQLKSQLAEKEALLTEALVKLEASKKVEELLASKPAQEDPTSQASGLNEEAISNLLEQKLQALKAQEQQEANYNTVVKTLTDKFGDGVGKAIQDKAAEFGYKPSELGELAKQNPKLVLSLFGTQSQPAKPAATGGHTAPVVPDAGVQPTKGLLVGAKSSDQLAHLRKIREEVYAQYGIQG